MMQVLSCVLFADGPHSHVHAQQHEGLPHLFKQGGISLVQPRGLLDPDPVWRFKYYESPTKSSLYDPGLHPL